MTDQNEVVTIILAEDDDGHATLVEKNLNRVGFLNKFIRVKDGQAVIDILENPKNEDDDSILSNPLLLVLDLKMPKLGGIETLKKIKSNPHYSRIPAIMFTTSDNPIEIKTCYELGCALYMTKPIIYDSFVEAIKRLGLFLELVKFPSSK